VSAPPGPTLRFRYGRTMGAGRMVKSVASGLAIAVAAAVVVAASVVGSPTTAGATPPGYPDFAPDEFVALLDRASLPGTTPPGGPPGITGDGPADARIVALAEGTHYRLRRLSASPHSSAAGVPLNTEAAAALVQMAAAASGAGAPFVAVSGHRSVDDQRGIFLRELAARGRARIGRAYSNQEIASGAADAAINDVLRLNSIPGYSFHHTGDAVDLVAPGGSLGGFASSAAYRWLSGANYANAKVFGFVPSYPVGASAIGPDPEPWEFTYVGVRELRCAADLVALWNPGVGRCPVGNLDGLAVSGTRVTIGGWAADPDAGTRPIDVHVQVDGAILAVRADRDRPDVGAVTPFGSRHGFEATVWLAPGRHTVCASAINDVPGEQATAIGCRVVDVRTRLPRGSLDRVASAGTRVRVDGWAADPDQPGAVLDVHLHVAGVILPVRAGVSRPDVAAATGLGPAHGFSAQLTLPRGLHRLCAFAISPEVGEGNPLLGCRTVDTRGRPPTGNLDVVRPVTDGRFEVVGWAADPDAPTRTVEVHLVVDGQVLVLRADADRPDVGAATPFGRLHGYTATVGVAPGSHLVCAYAIGEPGEPNTALGCRTVTR
jgi:LAS superfamily LD-carboxypeptidase LdcB